MKLALLADIHSNLEALEACLADARARGATRLAFIGDLVGYGADPIAVLDRIRAEVAQGAVVLAGNHDEAVVEGGSDSMNEMAEAAVRWTHARLDAQDLAFLGALPLRAQIGDALLVHASADAPERWIYAADTFHAARSLDAGGMPYVFSGHVHEQILFCRNPGGPTLALRPVAGVPVPVPRHRQWLAIVGSVGQPRDGNSAAAYALFDEDAALLTFRRVPYDFARAAAKIRAAGLPEFLAERLEYGL